MRVLFVLLLVLFSCNKKTVRIDVVPDKEVITVADEKKPLFKLGSVFEGKKSTDVERVPLVMPYSSPAEHKIVRASIRIDTISKIDTVVVTEYVKVPEYITKEVKQDGRWLVLILLIVGFVIGFVTRVILNKITEREKDE